MFLPFDITETAKFAEELAPVANAAIFRDLRDGTRRVQNSYSVDLPRLLRSRANLLQTDAPVNNERNSRRLIGLPLTG